MNRLHAVIPIPSIPTLGELRTAGAEVSGECLECGRRKRVDLAKLPLADDMPMTEAGYKLKCTDCGSKRVRLTVDPRSMT